MQPSMDATPLWVFCHHEDLDDAMWILPESELQETDSEMQQPAAGRDPGGEERLYVRALVAANGLFGAKTDSGLLLA